MPIIDRFERNPPAREPELSALISRLPFDPPPGYVEFLRESDGAEGMLGESYLAIWSSSQLLKRNEEYGVAEFAPHLFLFGSDGGGEAYAFDTRANPIAIVRVPFVGFDEETMLAHSFGEFMEHLSAPER